MFMLTGKMLSTSNTLQCSRKWEREYTVHNSAILSLHNIKKKSTM